MTLFALGGGAVIGYHIGLMRASEAIWGACLESARLPAPARKIAIMDCISAIEAIRPGNQPRALSMEEAQQLYWIREGIDEAIEAIEALKKLDTPEAAPEAAQGG